MKGKLTTVVVALLVVSTLGLAAVAGSTSTAAAATATATPTDDGPIANKVLDVSNDTRAVYVDVQNVTGGDGNLTVTVYGVERSGVETQVAQNTTLQEDDLYEYSVNSTKYDKYRVVVESGGDNDTATVDVGKLQLVSGGGSGGSSTLPTPGFGLVVALVALLASLGVARRRSSGGGRP